MPKIEFRAFIPPILSGIRTGGDSLRLTLDVPESDVQSAVALIALRNIALRVTIEVDDSEVATKPAPKSELLAEPEVQADAFDGVAEAHPDAGGPARPLPRPDEKWKPAKGPFGPYWKAMYAKGFHTFPELLKVLGVSGMGDTVKMALRQKFGVDSLTNVRPDRFERFCIEKRLPRELIDKSQRAREALADKKRVDAA